MERYGRGGTFWSQHPELPYLPVRRYVHPDTFARFETTAKALGFRHAAVGALVRSSYHADKQAERVLQES